MSLELRGIRITSRHLSVRLGSLHLHGWKILMRRNFAKHTVGLHSLPGRTMIGSEEVATYNIDYRYLTVNYTWSISILRTLSLICITFVIDSCTYLDRLSRLSYKIYVKRKDIHSVDLTNLFIYLLPRNFTLRRNIPWTRIYIYIFPYKSWLFIKASVSATQIKKILI